MIRFKGIDSLLFLLFAVLSDTGRHLRPDIQVFFLEGKNNSSAHSSRSTVRFLPS
jgi:hypothetical protein